MGAQTYSYVAYIDEAGDEGFKFKNKDGSKGSTEWFVLSGVLIRAEDDIKTTKLVDEVRLKISKSPKTVLHFKDLDHKRRVPYIDTIAKANIRASSVMIHKPSLASDGLKNSERLYFYASRLLLERITWYCRDAVKTTGDGSVLIVFSNKSSLKYDDFKKYMGRLFDMGAAENVKIAWNVLRDEQIVTHGAGERKGLQIADAVASGILAAVEQNQYGYTEPRYIEMLKPIVYERGGNYLSYGLKFMPKVPAAADCPWLAHFAK